MRFFPAAVHRRHGFTLIEIIIVFVIIAVLLGYIIPNYAGLIDEKKISEAESGVELYKIALDNYYRNNHSFPQSLGALTTADPRLLEVLPKDPFETNGQNFGYSLGTDSFLGSYYVVYSQGPNQAVEWQFINGEARKLSGDDIFSSNAPVLR